MLRSRTAALQRQSGRGKAMCYLFSLLFLLAVICPSGLALKPEDWKKCADAPFCNNLRLLPGPGHSLDVSTIKIKGSALTAELVEEAKVGDASASTSSSSSTPSSLSNRLLLRLTAFSGGNLRVHISEPGVKRFETTTVLRDDLSSWEVSWGEGAPLDVDAGAFGGGLLFDASGSGGPRVLISPSPFRIDLLPPRSAAERTGDAVSTLPVPIAVFNGAGGLLFQRRGASSPTPKAENETSPSPYPEESFKGHKDTVPNGPQAVGFDLSFPSALFVSGLPERAKKLALPKTLAGLPPRGTPSVPGIDANGTQTMTSVVDEPYRLYNLDVFEYLDDSNFGLYGSIPMLVAHSPAGTSSAAAAGNVALAAAKKANKKAGSKAAASFSFDTDNQNPSTAGAFWNNAAEMYVDVADAAAPASAAAASAAATAAAGQGIVSSPFAGSALTTHWLAEAGVVDLFLYSGIDDSTSSSSSSPASVASAHARATGTTALPQLFSLGYHQCRWNYRDERDARSVDAGFDAHAMPYDVLWLDIEHTDGKRYFTWDKDLFPEPKKLISDIASRGRKVVAIVDPHVKRDESYRIYSEARKKDFFVKDRSGTKDFEGWCWPGASAYLDMLLPAARDWWSRQFGLDKYPGSTPDLYIWNDMNEPSVFNGPEITMPKDARHRLGEPPSGSSSVEHREVHNVFGALFHSATARGLADRGRSSRGSDGDRPFVLSRAFFAGTQAVGPIWTGDNSATWPQLRVSIPMLLSLGLAGLPASGADVGGFFGDPDAELLTRWYQLGAYYPFFRGHAHLDTKRREPWLSGEPHTSVVRQALRERYRILPYLYTAFRQANVTGAPVMRPMFYEFPGESTQGGLAASDDQFMVGGSLLVAPALYPASEPLGQTRPVWLPRTQRWYDSVSGVEEVVASADGQTAVALPEERAPAWWRGGSVVALRERPRRSTRAALRDPLTLVVALDSTGKACGDLYLDDGSTFAFALRGAYSSREICFDSESGELTNRAAKDPLGKGNNARDARWKEPKNAVGGWKSGVSINRIVVLGHNAAGQGTKWKASVVVVGEERALDAAPGPLTVAPGAPVTAVVVRKPEVGADDDFTIKISRA